MLASIMCLTQTSSRGAHWIWSRSLPTSNGIASSVEAYCSPPATSIALPVAVRLESEREPGFEPNALPPPAAAASRSSSLDPSKYLLRAFPMPPAPPEAGEKA